MPFRSRGFPPSNGIAEQWYPFSLRVPAVEEPADEAPACQTDGDTALHRPHGTQFTQIPWQELGKLEAKTAKLERSMRLLKVRIAFAPSCRTMQASRRHSR